MRDLIKRIPVLRTIARFVYFTLVAPLISFPGSEDYWKQRYRSGRTSGAGSYHEFAEFKARVLNCFVIDEHIKTIIEYGCGDGNQLKLSKYPSYTGFDVSPEAISQCTGIFPDDGAKTFKLMKEYADETAELTLSLDVVYHLIEDNVYLAYMSRLFDSSTRFVIIYSSDTSEQEKLQAAHVRHRKFSRWVKQNRPEWKLTQHLANRYSYSEGKHGGAFADFFIYEKVQR